MLANTIPVSLVYIYMSDINYEVEYTLDVLHCFLCLLHFSLFNLLEGYAVLRCYDVSLLLLLALAVWSLSAYQLMLPLPVETHVGNELYRSKYTVTD